MLSDTKYGQPPIRIRKTWSCIFDGGSFEWVIEQQPDWMCGLFIPVLHEYNCPDCDKDKDKDCDKDKDKDKDRSRKNKK
jgi:hypothetical protein